MRCMGSRHRSRFGGASAYACFWTGLPALLEASDSGTAETPSGGPDPGAAGIRPAPRPPNPVPVDTCCLREGPWYRAGVGVGGRGAEEVCFPLLGKRTVHSLKAGSTSAASPSAQSCRSRSYVPTSAQGLTLTCMHTCGCWDSLPWALRACLPGHKPGAELPGPLSRHLSPGVSLPANWRPLSSPACQLPPASCLPSLMEKLCCRPASSW